MLDGTHCVMTGYASATDGPQLWVIDGVGGNDGNQGSLAEPLATIVEAEKRAPYLIDHDVEVRVVTPGTYVMPSFRPREYRGGQIYVRAVPNTSLYAGTAELGSGVGAIAKAGLAVDQYRDAFVRVLSGAAMGNYRMIKTNTADSIIPVRNFTAPIQDGDAFEIVTPLCVLDATSRPVVHGTLGGPGSINVNFETSLNIENFAIGGSAIFVAGRVAFWRCKTLPGSFGAITARGTNAQMMVGTDSEIGTKGAVAPQRVYGGNVKDWLGAGFVHNFVQEPDGGGFFGYLNSVRGLFVRNALYTQILGGNIRDDHLTVQGFGVVLVLGGDITTQVQVSDGQATGALKLFKGASCYLLNVRIDGIGTIAVAVESGARLDVGKAPGVQIVGGTYAILARRGAGLVLLQEDGPLISTVLPTGAKYAVGETPVMSNSLPAVGDCITSGDGSCIVRAA